MPCGGEYSEKQVDSRQHSGMLWSGKAFLVKQCWARYLNEVRDRICGYLGGKSQTAGPQYQSMLGKVKRQQSGEGRSETQEGTSMSGLVGYNQDFALTLSQRQSLECSEQRSNMGPLNFKKNSIWLFRGKQTGERGYPVRVKAGRLLVRRLLYRLVPFPCKYHDVLKIKAPKLLELIQQIQQCGRI